MRTLTEFTGAIRTELTFDPHQHQRTRLSPQLGYVWHTKCQEKCKFWEVMGSIYLCPDDTDLGKESTGEGVEISPWSEALQFFPKVLATSTPPCEFSAKDNAPGDSHWHKQVNHWRVTGSRQLRQQIDKDRKCPGNGFKGNLWLKSKSAI